MREAVHTLPDTKSFIELWEVMNKIREFGPSFHPVPSEGVVQIKVDEGDVEEARERLSDSSQEGSPRS